MSVYIDEDGNAVSRSAEPCKDGATKLADDLETLAKKAKGPWLSIPGDPAWLIEDDERAGIERSLMRLLRNAVPEIIAALRQPNTKTHFATADPGPHPWPADLDPLPDAMPGNLGGAVVRRN